MLEVALRETVEADLPLLFEHQRDPEARRMAAFTLARADDWDEFYVLWRPTLADRRIVKRTVLADGAVVGHVVCFSQGRRRCLGYWIARPHWGRGIATRAVSAVLSAVPTRPLYAYTAEDNAASQRVLEKCGFRPTGNRRPLFAAARGHDVAEVEFVLST